MLALARKVKVNYHNQSWSKLTPHMATIKCLRRKKLSWKNITKFFNENGLEISYGTVYTWSRKYFDDYKFQKSKVSGSE